MSHSKKLYPINLFHSQIYVMLFCCIILPALATPCKKGFYRGQNMKCKPCPAGTYSNLEGAQGLDVCMECPSGTVGRKQAATSISVCEPCPKGTSSHPGSMQYNQCKSCPPGTFIRYHDRKCIKCSDNPISVAPNSNSIRCISCPDDTAANIAKTKCIKCPPGSEYRDGKCKLCEKGSYNDGTASYCSYCLAGSSTNKDGTGCDRCPSGTFNGIVGGICKKCPKGQNIGAIGAESCMKPGTKCEPGEFRTDEGICRACIYGERFDQKLRNCVKCEKYAVSEGGFTTVCKVCSKDSVPSADRNRCVCPLGWTPYRNESCRECPAGRFVQSHSTIGSQEFHDTQSCNECPGGTYSTRGTVDKCEICPDGFEPDKNKTGCIPCAPGLRSYVFTGNSFSSSRCVDPKTNCPPGEERVEQFNDVLSKCGPRKCPKNTVKTYSLGQKLCVSCPIGTFFRFSEVSFDYPGYCVRCPKGLALSDSSGCKECPGKQTLTLPNQLGSFCGCKSDFYQDSILSRGSCTISCPGGEEQVFGGVFTSDKCEKCRPGTAREPYEEYNECFDCEIGFFTAKPGQRKCKQCPDGLNTTSPGSTACVAV